LRKARANSLEERRIELLAAIVMGADIVQVRRIGEGILSNDIDIAPIEGLILSGLTVDAG
jgi:hypothetical protein